MRLRLTAAATFGLLAFLSTVGTTLAQECFPAPGGLVAWWPGDGNENDIEGVLHGALQNGVIFGTGHVLQAFTFDGVDDRVLVSDTGNTLALSSFTYDVWVYPTAYPVGRSMRPFGTFRQDGGVNRGALISIDPESHLVSGGSTTKLIPRFDIYTTAQELSVYDDTITIPLNTWTHVAFTVDDATKQLKGYVNGALLTSLKQWPSASPFSGSFSGTVRYPSPIRAYIGADEQRVDEFVAHWIGSLDEVEVHNRALSAGEILAVHDAGTAGKCKDEDGDGFRPPEDCDETDPTVNPDGVELPGNFIDENCNGDLGECDPCFAWRNHGEYIRCTSKEAEALVDIGEITQEKADQLVSDAARSDIGKKGYSPPECQ